MVSLPTQQRRPTKPDAVFLREFYIVLSCVSESSVFILVPAQNHRPGRGVLSTARQASAKIQAPILDLEYRKQQLTFRRHQISKWLQNEVQVFKDSLAQQEKSGAAISLDEIAERYAYIEREAGRQEKEAQATFGMLSGHDPTVAPVKRALAVWGLTIDDIGIASVRHNITSLDPVRCDHNQMIHSYIYLFFIVSRYEHQSQ